MRLESEGDLDGFFILFSLKCIYLSYFIASPSKLPENESPTKLPEKKEDLVIEKSEKSIPEEKPLEKLASKSKQIEKYQIFSILNFK